MTVLRTKLRSLLAKAKTSLKNKGSIAIAISLLIHGSAGYYLYKFKIKPKLQPIEIKITQKKSGGDIVPKLPEPAKKKMVKSKGHSKKYSQKKVDRALARIIPKALRAMVAQMKPTKGRGYYGMGYYEGPNREVFYNGGIISGVEFSTIIEGYPAETNGIRTGDVLIMCDGHWGVDATLWVKGSGPTPITMIIYRNGQVFEIHTRREWISEEDKAPQRSGP